MAVDFRFVPRLEVSETYTDNVRLTEDNTQEDFVTTATFGGTLTAQSRKLNLSADYGGKYLIFAKSDEEDFRNSGRVAATFNAVEDYFSIRADGIIDQQFANRGGGSTFSEATLSENLRTIKSVSVQPSLTNRFGTFARFNADYRVSYTDSTQPVGAFGGISDSFSQDLNVNLTSGEQFGRLRWRLFGQLRKDDRRGQISRDFERKEAGLDLSYAVRRGIFVEGSVGYGKTDFRNVVRENENIIWNAGLRLQPNRRLTASVRYGRQFRNNVWSAQLSWRASGRTRLSASYSDQLTTSQQVIADIGGGFDPTQPIPPDTGIDPDFPGFTLTDSGFRRQRLNAAINHNTRRWTAELSGFAEQRNFERTDLAPSDAYGGRFNFSYDMSRNTQLSLRALYRHDKFNEDDRSDDTVIGSVSISHTLSNYLSASLTASRAQQLSNLAFADVKENSVRLLIRGTF